MFRRTVLAAGIAATAFVTVPSTAVSAAVETCRGEEATIVGAPLMDDLHGTPGRDVIVTNGSFEVQAGDGDDLICVTGGDNSSIYAGRGDDVVDATTETHIWAELGPGADSFEGGDGPDTVWAGDERDDGDERDAERDLISTGRGFDMVMAGEADVPFQDQIDTGRGSDWLSIAATAGDGSATLELGGGSDQLGFGWPEIVSGSWVFDNAAQALTKDGTAQFGWSGAESFYLPDLRANPVTFLGSDHSESVTAGMFASVDLRGGADDFWIRPVYIQDEISEAGDVDGGAGRDVFVTQTYDNAFVDLGAGIARFAEFNLGDVRLIAIEDVTMYGGHGEDTMRGSAGHNVLRSETCDLTANAGPGADQVISTAVDCFEGEGAALRGGPGNDLLRGSGTPDRLAGGTGADRLFGRGGRDVANGGQGADVCAAEVRRSCSVP